MTSHALRCGKQGLVGVVRNDKDGKEFLYKFSSTLNFIGTHEYLVLKALDPIRSYCPFFVRALDLIPMKVDENCEEQENVFEINNKPIVMDTCLLEYIKNSRKLSTFIRHTEVGDNIILSVVKQALTAMHIAYKHNRTTSYDLHPDNILVRKCGFNDIYLYSNGEQSILMPTYGYYGTIIDFGFAYSDDLSKNITTPLNFMQDGYTSHKPNSLVDSRILLVSLCDDIHSHRRDTELFDRLQVFVYRLFERLDIDFESGWLINKENPACDLLFNCINEFPPTQETIISEGLGFILLDLIQTLIPHPLNTKALETQSEKGKEPGEESGEGPGEESGEEEEPSELQDVVEEFMMGYSTFLKDFRTLQNDFRERVMYAVRCLVLAAIPVQEQFIKTNSDECVRKFKNVFFDMVRPLKSFYTPKINHRRVLTSLLVMANSYEKLLKLEGVYREQFVERQDKRVALNSSWDILRVLDHHFPTSITLSPESKILFMDEATKTMNAYYLDKDTCATINDLPYDQRSEAVLNYIKNTNDSNSRKPSLSEDEINDTVGMDEWNDSEDEIEEEEEESYNWKLDTDDEEEKEEDKLKVGVEYMMKELVHPDDEEKS